MSRELTATGQICNALDKMEGSLNEALNGTGVSVSRFLATAKTAVQTHTDQKGLEGADRNSLYLAIKKAAGDGLMPDNREAALVLYNTNVGTKEQPKWVKQVQYQPMVQGLVKLARKSGEIESISSEVVYSNDKFKLDYSMDGVDFSHSPCWTGDRGEPILVWATVKLKSGEVMARAYPKKRIDSIAGRSKMADNYNPLKGKDWEEFWRKAAIRNILKYAPKSTSLEQAMQESDKEFDYDSDKAIHDSDGVVNPVNDAPKTESKAATVIKAKAATKKQPEPEDNIIDVEAVEYDPNDTHEDEEIPV